MTKKPHKLRGGHIQRAAAAAPKQLAGLGILGVPGLRNAAEKAAAAEMDAMRAVLWAHNYGLNLQELRHMTLRDFAHHISRNTAWGAIEIPSYVLATIAAMQPTEPPAKPMSRSTVHAVIHDEAKAYRQERVGEWTPPEPPLDPNKYEVANGPDGPMIFETDKIPPDTMHRTTWFSTDGELDDG